MCIRDREERRSMVKQHVLIMYGVFFMFLAISIMIIFVMVPMLKSPESLSQSQETYALHFADPCQDWGAFPCDLYHATAWFFNTGPGIVSYYVPLFFYVVIIQGIFTGLIAGQLGENSIIAGSKHSLIMVSISFAIFMFLSKTGLLPT